MNLNPLGRRTPTSWTHVDKYPLRTLLGDPAHPLDVPPGNVEVGLGLPRYWQEWDQGSEGACVGYGASAMMAITNTRQAWRAGRTEQHRYEPRWLYQQAQQVDDWDETPPEEGTSVRAACDILRDYGARRVVRGVVADVDPAQGISANRWAITVDEIRAALYAQLAVSIGVNWYAEFDRPYVSNGEHWLPEYLETIRGGHCVCIYRMSDRRQAFRFLNSWGAGYPPTWIPYPLMQRLLAEDGEAAVITDR